MAVKWSGVKGAVTGTLKKDPESVKILYGADEQTGHFFPVQFKEQYYSKPVVISGRAGGDKTITPTAEDPYLIIRLENLSGNTAAAKVQGTAEEIFTLDFTGATKAEA